MAANSEKEADQQPSFLLSFSNQKQWGSGLFESEKNESLPPPPPCIELSLSDQIPPTVNYKLESINFEFDQALTLLKGRVSTQEVLSLSNSDLVPGKYEGGLKLWEGSIDLVKTLHTEIQDGNLSLTGKQVLELGCGHGLPGIFTCLKGAAAVHFQDFNAEVLRCLTIPNVNANLEKEAAQSKFEQERAQAEVRFFAGDWSEVDTLLRHDNEKPLDSISEHDSTIRYDVILMAETVYSISSHRNLYELIKKCVRHPDGVVYMAGKKHYFGVGGGTRHFLAMVEKDGVMAASLVAEVTDGSSNVREVWKLSVK